MRRTSFYLDVLGPLVDRAAGARGSFGFGEGVVLVLGTVEGLLEDGLGLVDLELGLEVAQVCRVATAVGAATGVGEVEFLVEHLLANFAPASELASTANPERRGESDVTLG